MYIGTFKQSDKLVPIQYSNITNIILYHSNMIQ